MNARAPLPAPLRFAREAWRRLRTMRTAIILLLVLAAGASVGSFIPQRPFNPRGVRIWIADHPGLAPLAERLGLFDVYGSWWFMAIYALLLTSLVGCLAPRYRAYWRQMRSSPRARASLAGVTERHERELAVAPEAALSAAERVLRRRRYRLLRDDGAIAAEKGHLREGGSLVFHTSFLILLLGVSIGKLFGFTGQVAIVEGQRFTDTPIAYDSLDEGRFFAGRHRGFTIELQDFDVWWHPNGVPGDFTSRIRVLDGAREVGEAAVRVNHPYDYRGVKVYQVGWGWAPVVRVEKDGAVLADGPIVFLDDPDSGSGRGVAKVPSAPGSQLGLEMWVFQDFATTEDSTPFNRSPEPKRPVMLFQEYRGDLNLRVPQSVYSLDKRSLVEGDAGVIPLGRSAALPDGTTVSFTELRQFSVFQLASNPGVPFLFWAGVAILAGLIPALYSSRRRVWVRADPFGEATRLQVAGQALQNRAAFEEEFRTLVHELGEELRAGGARHDEGVPVG